MRGEGETLCGVSVHCAHVHTTHVMCVCAYVCVVGVHGLCVCGYIMWCANS